MSGVAAAIGGAALIGYLSSQNAADTQATAAQNANNTQRGIYNQQRADTANARNLGDTASAELYANNFGKDGNWKDPGYEARLKEGYKAVNGMASARGGLNSGATMKALTRYGQEFASNEYGKAYDRQFNRLSTLAGYGNGLNPSLSNAGSNYASNVGNNMMGAANAQSAAQMAQGNAISGGLSTGANYYLQRQAMQQAQPTYNTMPNSYGAGSSGAGAGASGYSLGGYGNLNTQYGGQ
ncbi:hypothetical protein UFOVP610_9 [uncultured Caudovirales phage]|uniref:DNA transfer protein n=1 Tax=uncultured Caudovirales phage TaxID=2100421 RepID=A0A6J5N4Z2_9CAUD|nr:hypothetical protein UFOVP610_9 [uncultured Caudovirales phage]